MEAASEVDEGKPEVTQTKEAQIETSVQKYKGGIVAADFRTGVTTSGTKPRPGSPCH
jgi:hypothetical protein